MGEQIIDLTPQVDEVFDVRISVSKELAEHYNKILSLRDTILDDEESEDKSKISAINATTTIIKELASIQNNLYNSETFAVLQQVILNCLKDVDEDLKDRVLEKFEERLETL